MENEIYEKKSLNVISGKSPDWNQLAKDCVCFANAKGGKILIGIEDKEDFPPVDQVVRDDLVNNTRKRISDLTINVGIIVSKKTASNGGEFIEIDIKPSVSSIASTTDGKYYIRIADSCKPILPDELSRLFTDKPAFIWETKVVQKVGINECDNYKLEKFIYEIKQSSRVSDFVKQKSNEELLSYYQMYSEGFLTNLGILWVGKREHRARLQYAPVVQFIKYDNNGNKIGKKVWDDFSLNPKELIQDIWEKIPEWKYGIEISKGVLGREIVYHYNENVVRELLANALVHRPYTTRGDVFINYYPDRLEIHNPGLLPLGVTPDNILHQSIKRNEHLSKIFYDLNLMEREGSGYDKIYEILVSEAKQIPLVEEKQDRVSVTVFNNIKNEETIHIVEKIKNRFLLNQREVICLGIIAQNKSIIATEFAKTIQTKDDKQIKSWLGNLLKSRIVLTKGKTKGTEYYINSEMTNFVPIEEDKLKARIMEYLEKHPDSSINQIYTNIGFEISIKKLRSCIYNLVDNGSIGYQGGKKFRTYFIDKNKR